MFAREAWNSITKNQNHASYGSFLFYEIGYLSCWFEISWNTLNNPDMLRHFLTAIYDSIFLTIFEYSYRFNMVCFHKDYNDVLVIWSTYFRSVYEKLDRSTHKRWILKCDEKEILLIAHDIWKAPL